MSDKRDYYEVLGVSKTASEDDIKKAFRTLSRKYHPDMQQGKSDAEKKNAEEKFKEIASAYEVLGDKDKRQQYDQFGFSDGRFDNGMDMDMDDFMSRHADMFSGMFSGFGPFGGMFGHSARRSYSQPDPREDGSPMKIHSSLTFKEAVFGCTKDFDYRGQKECSACHGTGTKSGSAPTTCPNCGGSGMMTARQRTPFGMSIVQSTCSHCGGSGHIAEPCPVCGGTKRVYESKHVTVKIPAGITNGQRVRLAGMGQCGVCGGKNGDLFIDVDIGTSPVFSRKGQFDIEIEKFPISPFIATFGGKVDVPTLHGIKKLEIPAGTASGKTFKISGQGVKPHGDFYVTVVITPIVNMTEEESAKVKEALSQLGNSNVKGLNDMISSAQSFYHSK